MQWGSLTGTKCTLHVTDLHSSGVGVGQHAIFGRVYVPFAFPGDQIEVELLREIRPAQWRARRITPVHDHCDAAGRCGGCLWPGAAYAAQLNAKEKLLRRVLQMLPQLAALDIRTHGNVTTIEFRNRIHLHARFFRGQLALGFYERGSQRLVEINDCPVAVPALRQLIGRLAQIPKAYTAEDFGFGIELVAYAEEAGQTELILYGSPKRHEFLRQFARTLASQMQTPVLLHQRELPVAFRLWQRAQGVNFYTAPGCFQQGNSGQSDLIRGLMLRQACGARAVFDLFCGSGNYSLTLAKAGMQVFGCDENKIAIAVAQENLRQNQIVTAQYIEGDAATVLGERGRHGWPQSADLVILDPARWGIGRAIPGMLAQIRPQVIVLVSNHLQALATDARLLCKNGFVPQEIHLVDFFPHTPHMDVVTVWRGEFD